MNEMFTSMRRQHQQGKGRQTDALKISLSALCVGRRVGWLSLSTDWL